MKKREEEETGNISTWQLAPALRSLGLGGVVANWTLDAWARANSYYMPLAGQRRPSLHTSA